MIEIKFCPVQTPPDPNNPPKTKYHIPKYQNIKYKITKYQNTKNNKKLFFLSFAKKILKLTKNIKFDIFDFMTYFGPSLQAKYN